MKCADHPRYTGQRKPRSDCKGCWDVYNKGKGESNETKPAKAIKSKDTKKAASAKVEKPKPKPKPKTEKPQPTWAERQDKIKREYSETQIIGRKPDRLLSQSPTQFRKEISLVLSKLFPEYAVATNGDASVIHMMSRNGAMYGTNTWVIDGKTRLEAETKKAEAIAKARKEEIDINFGDVFFSEKLDIPIAVIGYNDKTKKVAIRDWHTQELSLISEEEFHKLGLREIVSEADFGTSTKLKTKVTVF